MFCDRILLVSSAKEGSKVPEGVSFRKNETVVSVSVYSAVFRAPQHPQLRGAQTLEGATREWEKFRLELKRAIPGYATDVFVMLELKTKLLFCFFQFQLLDYEKLQFTPC